MYRLCLALKAIRTFKTTSCSRVMPIGTWCSDMNAGHSRRSLIPTLLTLAKPPMLAADGWGRHILSTISFQKMNSHLSSMRSAIVCQTLTWQLFGASRTPTLFWFDWPIPFIRKNYAGILLHNLLPLVAVFWGTDYFRPRPAEEIWVRFTPEHIKRLIPTHIAFLCAMDNFEIPTSESGLRVPQCVLLYERRGPTVEDWKCGVPFCR